MKVATILGVLAFVGASFSQTKDVPRGKCPRSSSGIGTCVFDPEENCTGDEKCENGQICCPDKCNRICKDPISEVLSTNGGNGQCPPAKPTYGACEFIPGRNCLGDNECKVGQICCPDSCGKICKDTTKPDPYVPPTPTIQGQCPPAKPTYGACEFIPGTNCLGDNECKVGQICCPDGCGKMCKDSVLKPEDRCPDVDNTIIGACIFDPKVNCIDDTQCNNGRVCCNSGCNKICLVPKPVLVPEASKP